MHPLVQLLGSPHSFLDSLFDQLNSNGVDVSALYMDHICFRVEDMDDYHSLQAQLLKHGHLLSDKMIGDRPISVIQLDQSYKYGERKIDIIELPSPKNGSPYPKGYEHVEFVINTDLSDFISTYSTIGFDLKGMSKAINPDVRIQLLGSSVKFHEHSLKYVIEILEK